MTVNTDLIDAVFGQITAENFYMGSWASARAPEDEHVPEGTEEPPASCGTTMCFAGHTVVAAGHKIAWTPLSRFNDETGRYEVTAWDGDFTTDGRRIETLAQELLGLDSSQAYDIFHAVEIGRDVERLKERVSQVLSRTKDEEDYDIRCDNPGCDLCYDNEDDDYDPWY